MMVFEWGSAKRVDLPEQLFRLGLCQLAPPHSRPLVA